MRSQTPNKPPAQLIALGDKIQLAQYPLDETVSMIGRSDICQIIVADERVSRLHAVIEYDAGCYTIHDSNSANGTYVNGRRIREPHRLQDQDEIGLSAAAGLLRFEMT